MSQIKYLRKKLTRIITAQIKPIRAKLDELLNIEAAKLCPFALEEVITLDNGKKGQITEIKYYSLEKNYSSEKEREYEFLASKIDEIDYLYAYQLDEDKFTITWEIAGVYMIQKNTVPGKIRFYGINPASHIIDVVNKSVKVKAINQLVADENYLEIFWRD